MMLQSQVNGPTGRTGGREERWETMREAGVELAMQHLKQRALFCVLCFF